MKLKEAIRLANALPPTGEGVEHILKHIYRWSPHYKQRVYAAIAWNTGLTWDEIAKIERDCEYSHERR